MRNTKLAVFGVAVLTMTLATGCAKPPQQEIDGLNAALTGAEETEAPKYAPDAWSAAQNANNAVQAEVEAQNNKFALFRSYTRAKELIAEANQAAEAAQAEAATGKEAARNEAVAALAAVQESLATADGLLADLASCRRTPKGFKKDLEGMRGMYEGYAAQVAGIDGALAAEDFLAAKSQAESLQASVDALVADLESGKEKMRC